MPCRKTALRCVIASLLLLSLPAPSLADNPERIGVVGSMNGAVTARMEDVVRPLKVGDPVYLNETIHAEKGSTAQLMFMDKSSLTVAADTEVKVDIFVYDPATSAGSMSLQGAKGTFRFIGGALSKKDEVVIKTPVSTIGIRGGIVQVNIASDGSSAQALFFYGVNMSVKTDRGATQFTTQFGQGVATRRDGNSEIMTPADVKAGIRVFNASAHMPLPPERPMPGRQGVDAPPADGRVDGGPKDAPADSGIRPDPSKPGAGSTDQPRGDLQDFPDRPDMLGNTANKVGINNLANRKAELTTNDYRDPVNWGRWADTTFVVRDTSGKPVPTIASGVIGLPLLATDLTTLAPTFSTLGTVTYNGAVRGESQILGGPVTPEKGAFYANIDFNNHLITGLGITMGGFTLNSFTPQSDMSSVPITGSLATPSITMSGTANLGLFGNKANILAGEFTATSGASPATTAKGVMVGGRP